MKKFTLIVKEKATLLRNESTGRDYTITSPTQLWNIIMAPLNEEALMQSQSWPTYHEAKARSDEITQINEFCATHNVRKADRDRIDKATRVVQDLSLDDLTTLMKEYR